MEYSKLNLKLSFREKLSYIQNSDEYKGIFCKFRVVCKLILSCGRYDLHLTENKCSEVKEKNNTCIFSRKIETLLLLNKSIHTGSSPAQEGEKLNIETSIPHVTKEENQAQGDKHSTHSAGDGNTEPEKKGAVPEEKNKLPLSKSAVHHAIAQQAHPLPETAPLPETPNGADRAPSGEEVKENSENDNKQKEDVQFLAAGNSVKTELYLEPAAEDKQNTFPLNQCIMVAKNEIKNSNKVEQEKKAAKAQEKDKIEENKEENYGLDTKTPLNEPGLKMNIYSHTVNEFLGAIGKDAHRLLSFMEKAKTQERRETANSIMKRYNTLGSEIDLGVSKGITVFDSAMAQRVRELSNDYLNFVSSFAGDQMTNNSAISDLGDPMRAMKAAEAFNSIYCDEWVDADEILKGIYGYSEKESATYLCSHVEKCYEFWCTVINNILESDDFIKMEEYSEQNDSITTNTSKLDKLRRIFSEKKDKEIVLKGIFSDASPKISMPENKTSKSIKTTKATKATKATKEIECYSRKLNNIIPFLLLQDISCELEFPKEGRKFDKNLHSHYTISKGDYIEYVVWPVTYNSKDEGAGVLYKAVIQPCSSN